MATNNADNIPTAASGKVLQGAGVGTAPTFSTPTYPSTSGSAGKIIRSDGTNNLYSTATYPDTAGTSGNVMTSDGTNWTSAAASGGAVTVATKALTNAQIKALHATPIQIVAAPGVGKAIVVVNSWGKFIYGGTNVFVAAAAQSATLYYGTTQFATGNTAGSLPVITNPMITGSASVYGFALGIVHNTSASTGVAIANFENLALNIYNPSATEITGNAAGDNTMDFAVLYYIVTL